MFLEDGDLERIVRRARDDLREFLNKRFPAVIWGQAKSAAEAIEREFQDCDDMAGFTQKLLPWLQDRLDVEGNGPSVPWEQDSAGHWKIGNSHIAYFLKQLEIFWLDKLIWPGCEKDAFLLDYSPHGSDKFQEFLLFIGWEMVADDAWRVTFLPKGEGQDLKDFVSWLIVNPSSESNPRNSLHIIYDRKKISAISDDKCERQTSEETVIRFEKIFLHEVGHARTILDWYIDQFNQGVRQVEAKPSDEYKAWIYCMAVRSCIIATRAWISRIRTGEDNEWRRHF